jgi:flagella basal body P-ring formation protein FlgA
MMLALLAAALVPGVPCQPVRSDRIYARDIAVVLPAFASVSPDLEIGFAPAPGQQRTFRAAELHRLAQAQRVQTETFRDVCFAWPTSIPPRDTMLAAMQETLTGRKANIEIVDQSLSPAPLGKPTFPISGLCGFSAEPVVWRGYITYGENHRFTIWARVRVTVKESRVIARDTLVSGEPVRATQLETHSYEGPLSRQETVIDLSDAIGKIAKFDIPAGAVLVRNMLESPHDVERGDAVKVIVEAVGARIEAEGIAEQAGQTGATIVIRNAKSGIKFRARIQGKDIVIVTPGAFAGLATEESKS